MKKLFTLFLALVATTALWAYDFQVDSICYNITSDTTVKVTSSVASPGNETNYPNLTIANIPETVIYNGSTYSVTSIGNSAFLRCSSLTSVTIPNSVTSIGYSFHGCSSLTTVVWNAHNAPIRANDGPFRDCPIASFTFGEEVKHIPYRLCSGLTRLTSVTIPNSVTSIGAICSQDLL